MRIRRSLLFMPADDRRKIEKAATLDVDSIIMDLEDGVAVAAKAEARHSASAALETVVFGRTERLVRINGVETPLYADDLAATFPARPDGYVIPKVESADALLAVSAWLDAAEYEQGGSGAMTRLLALIESARGVVNLAEIVRATPRLDALIFGAEDLAADIGAQRSPDGWEVFYARSSVVVHAAAQRMQAIDGVHIQLDDSDGLIAQTQQARDMGYTGKLAVHPRQVPIIQQIFTPTEDEINRAQRLVDAFAAQQAENVGVFELDGRMVDMPMVRAAETILARARAAGVSVR